MILIVSENVYYPTAYFVIYLQTVEAYLQQNVLQLCCNVFISSYIEPYGNMIVIFVFNVLCFA